MPRILIIAAIIVALVFGGKLLYRHFVTNRIVDWSGMVIYEPMGNEDGTFLSRYCHGTWWMENDCLYLDTYNDRGDMVGGLFPVLLSFSGEQLLIMQAADGSVPPFFKAEQTTAILNLTTLP